MFDLPLNPTFAIVGSGAVGCYYGGRLAQHGHPVHFLMRSDYDHVRAHGMRIQSCDGDFDLPAGHVQAYRSPQDMPKVDVVIVTLKTTANSQFAQLITPLLHEGTCILTLQNGLGNEQRLADLFGAQGIIGGLAFVCINRVAPGHISHTDYGHIKIGEFGRAPTARLTTLRDIFRASNVRCETLDDLAMGRWEKLIWNIPFNGLGAALGLTTDRIVYHPEGIELVRGIMREVVAAAHAAGVALDESLVEQNIQRTLTMGPYRSSMQIDRENGRPIELESIIGEPLRVAGKHGVATPSIQMLYRLLAISENASP